MHVGGDGGIFLINDYCSRGPFSTVKTTIKFKFSVLHEDRNLSVKDDLLINSLL